MTDKLLFVMPEWPLAKLQQTCCSVLLLQGNTNGQLGSRWCLQETVHVLYLHSKQPFDLFMHVPAAAVA